MERSIAGVAMRILAGIGPGDTRYVASSNTVGVVRFNSGLVSVTQRG